MISNDGEQKYETEDDSEDDVPTYVPRHVVQDQVRPRLLVAAQHVRMHKNIIDEDELDAWDDIAQQARDA